MPQDPNLYGQRPVKRQKKETIVPNSLSFTAELTSLLSKPASSSSTTTGRARPSKSKPDIFAGVKAKRKADKKGARDRDEGKLVLKEVAGTEDDRTGAVHIRRKMEDKARLYAAMKRGDYIAKEGEAAPLVDFDRKWAQNHEDGAVGGSGSDEEEDEEEDEMDREIIEYEDEFGRTRRGTRAEKERMDRRLRMRELGAAELERMSARPKAPENIIYGDTVQVDAFVAADEEKMEEIARKRDRSATPPEAKHYDASHEIRTKGVGFFQFSKDEATRLQEMKNLEQERLDTEKARNEKEAKKEARKKEIEARRAQIEARRKKAGEKNAKKIADDFLDQLADIFTSKQNS